jgi:hypothetical protein
VIGQVVVPALGHRGAAKRLGRGHAGLPQIARHVAQHEIDGLEQPLGLGGEHDGEAAVVLVGPVKDILPQVACDQPDPSRMAITSALTTAEINRRDRDRSARDEVVLL